MSTDPEIGPAHDRVSDIGAPPSQIGPSVRAVFTAAVVEGAEPPFDRVQARVYYPAAEPDATALDSGILAVASGSGPLPVVVIAGGVNCGPEAYTWLAHRIAEAGMCAVTYSYTAPTYRGLVGLVPDHGFGGPDSDGTITRAVIEAVARASRTGPLEGRIDLDRIGLFGHSAGGRTALYLSADRELGLQAVAVYAAHTMMRGADDRPIQPELVPSSPVMMLIGAEDGVISRSRSRYGALPEEPWEPGVQTFLALSDEIVDGHHVVRLTRGTHFSVVHPHDSATGRLFLEEIDEEAPRHRRILGDLITGFMAAHLRGDREGLTATLAAVKNEENVDGEPVF